MLFLLFAYVAYSAQVENMSFTSPLLPRHRDNWEIAGTATSLSGFVRLTPTASDKQGHLKSKNRINVPSFESTFFMQISGKQPANHQGMMILLTSDDTNVGLGKFYGANENFTGLGVIFDTKRNLIVGVDNTDGKTLSAETLPMDKFCGAPFMNAQFYLKLEQSGKELIVSYKKDGSEFTPCFTIEKSMSDPQFMITATTSPTDTQTYDIYNLETTISDDMMGPIMDMIADIQDGMKEEVHGLREEVADITTSLSGLPTKDNLKALGDMIVKTREQIMKINETVGKLHQTTVSITNTRSADNTNKFAKEISQQVDKIDKHIKNLDTELDIEGLGTKFEDFIDNQISNSAAAKENLDREMENLENMTKQLSSNSSSDSRLYIIGGCLGVVCLFGVVLLRKAKKLEKSHMM